MARGRAVSCLCRIAEHTSLGIKCLQKHVKKGSHSSSTAPPRHRTWWLSWRLVPSWCVAAWRGYCETMQVGSSGTKHCREQGCWVVWDCTSTARHRACKNSRGSWQVSTLTHPSQRRCCRAGHSPGRADVIQHWAW